jgi:DNA-binding MarR family transcriptional regulator
MSADDDDNHNNVLRSAGYLLMKAGHYIGTEFDTALTSLGLTGREFLLLSFVRPGSPLSQHELGGRLGIDPTLIVGLVDGLEARGLMKRARDPADRRRNVLTPTDEGIRVHDAAIAAARQAEDAFLAPLTSTQRTELANALRAVLSPRLSWVEP